MEEGINMKALIVTAILAACVGSVPSAWAITFNINTGSYSTFIGQARNELKHPTLVYHGIPMINPPSNPPIYLLVDLVLNANPSEGIPAITVSIQINKNNLYVVGYRDQYNGKDRVHYFTDFPATEQAKVFPNVKDQREKIAYKSTYGGIQGAAGVARENFQLGLKNLEDHMRNAYGKDKKKKDFDKVQAKFLLCAVQMVSEAARFKYVEGKAGDNFIPDYKVPSLENAWDPLSTAIVTSSKEGVFKSTIKLKDANNKDWPVSKVSQIKDDMGLLTYVKVKAVNGFVADE